MQDERERQARAEATLWSVLGTLFRWRWFVAGVTAGVGAAAVVITLMMPNVYQSTARVLMPEAGGGLSAAMLRNLPSAASALLGGGGGGDYMRYLSILTSRSVMEAAVDSFDLITVYEAQESQAPLTSAIGTLRKNTAFEIDKEYEFLSVSVRDLDPERAAALANFFVRRLNEMNARLTSQSAGNYRQFIEARYHKARADMDSVLDATQAFQQEYGIYDLPAQTQGFFEQLASLRAKAMEAEIHYEALREQFGSENAQVQGYRDLARAANEQYRRALEGQERLLPVPQTAIPALVRRYTDLEMERTIQVAVIEVLGPLYEQARLQEEREVEAVQVLDLAVPPELKVSPKRSVICVLATVSGFFLTIVFVLFYTWFQRNHASLLHRLQTAAGQKASDASKIPTLNA